jgi:hypothetical protein
MTAPSLMGSLDRMHPILRQELDRNDGLLVVRRLPAGVPRWALSNATRAGHLERVHPGVYRDPAKPDDPLRSAAAYVGDLGALSHTTAAHIWGFAASAKIVHVTVPRGVRIRSTEAIIVHPL